MNATKSYVVVVAVVLGATAIGAVAGAKWSTQRSAASAARSEAVAETRAAELHAEVAKLKVQLGEASAARSKAETEIVMAYRDRDAAVAAKVAAEASARAPATPADRARRLASATGLPSTSASALDHEGVPGVWVSAEMAAELEARAARADALGREVATLERVVVAERARAAAAIQGEGLALALAEAHRRAYEEAEASRSSLASQASGPWWERPEPWVAVAAVAVAGAVVAVAAAP